MSNCLTCDTACMYRGKSKVKSDCTHWTEGKPPLGCKPYYISIPERIRELSQTIERNAESASVAVWAKEIELLSNVMREMDSK